MYPVDNRKAETLISIIQKHVVEGTRVYSDSWGAYLALNELGYEHFTVIHKTTFKQRYKNVETGQIVDCHTNRIEGAWKICKDHFRRINGSNTKLFEQYLAEIIWRNHVYRENIYEAFFTLLKEIYTLYAPAHYTYCNPLFGTWTPPTTEVEKAHHMTIVQGSDSDSDSESDAGPSSVPIASSTLNDIPPSNSPDTPVQSRSYRSTFPQPSTSSDINIDDRHVTVCRPRKERQAESSEYELDTSQKKLAHPNTFQPLRKKKSQKSKKTAKTISQKQPNPYSRTAFFEFASSDSDFQ